MTLKTLPKINLTSLESTSLASLVGNTPLVPLEKVGAHLPSGVRVFAKAEWFNPSGSIKDRPALGILRAALVEGHLVPGRRLLDSTSGNMGIAYATLGAALDIPITLAIPANASPERLATLRALGAELHLTDPLEGTDGAIQVARDLASRQPERYFYARQYDNPANWLSHYHSTGPEILNQTGGEVTHFVAGLGTTGTLVGTGRYLQENLPGVQIIAVQPDSPFHGLEGLKHLPSAIQPEIYDSGLPDSHIVINTEAAHQMTLRLAREEGYFVGISSGAAALAALEIAAGLENGTVVTIFPDSGLKYLSETFWEREN